MSDSVKKSQPCSDPLEVALVYTVRSCRTCHYFWPPEKPQPYGPFPTYDFTSNTPEEQPPPSPWIPGKTSEPGFPSPEIMDGCRKAPIMTIGINPNLTAFSPGQKGASWCYLHATSDDNTDEWVKYSYYYRYRTIYQECFSLDFIKSQLLPEGQIIAEDSGTVVSSDRTSDSPNFVVYVQYDGSEKETKIPLERKVGEPRYVLLFDKDPPTNRFQKGDIIAARLTVSPGQNIEVYQQKEEYYEQFIPVLEQFEHYLQDEGHTSAQLRMGEDVCQLDMVGCASPHWSPDYLGGTSESENTLITDCVSTNAFAMKQLVQTRPVVLFLVGEATYTMFKGAFGKHITADPPLPSHPEDGAFTLFRSTTDTDNPCVFAFSTTIDGMDYSLTTQIVVTPHFSYGSNFLPQFRMSPDNWDTFKTEYYDCYQFLKDDHKRVKYVPSEKKEDFVALEVIEDEQGVMNDLKEKYPGALSVLMKGFYDVHSTMAEVLGSLYRAKKLLYTDGINGPGYLARTEGSCRFCVNNHWEFPLKCPYNKNEEAPPPPGFLEKVAEAIAAGGKVTEP
jgi:hypothetical protein